MMELRFGDEVMWKGRKGVVVDERRYSESGVGVQPEMQFSKWGGSLAGNPTGGVGSRPDFEAALPLPVYVRLHGDNSPRWLPGTELTMVGSDS